MRLLQTLLLLMLLSQPQAKQLLRVLAWPGYADADVVASFEQRFDATVQVTTVSTDDELWQLASANQGENFDLIALNTAELQRYIDNRLVQPLNVANIPNSRLQQARFRKLNKVGGITRSGVLYALPYTYSEMGLIYNRQLVAQAPDSMAALWDKRYQGQVGLFEGSVHNFSFTALQMGIRNPFQLNDEQFRRVIKQLVALRQNRPRFYSTPEQAVALFREQPMALLYGNYGNQQVQALRQAGFDVGYIVPKEGALAWLDCWAMLQGAKNPSLAESWINHTLSREVSQLLTQRQGLANTIEGSPNSSESDRLLWLQPVEDSDKRAIYWQRILSGARKGMY